MINDKNTKKHQFLSKNEDEYQYINPLGGEKLYNFNNNNLISIKKNTADEIHIKKTYDKKNLRHYDNMNKCFGQKNRIDIVQRSQGNICRNNTYNPTSSQKSRNHIRRNSIVDKSKSLFSSLTICWGNLPKAEFWKDQVSLNEFIRRPENENTEVGVISFNSIYDLSLKDLSAKAKFINRDNAVPMSRQNIITRLMQKSYSQGINNILNGVLEILPSGNGLLTYEKDNYSPRPLSAFVHSNHINKYGLKRGHELSTVVHPPRDGESCPFVVKIKNVGGVKPESIKNIVHFSELKAYYPTKRILLENDSSPLRDKLSMRVIDLIAPIGFGQRGLIVAPPRTGKTILLQGIANAIKKNNPEAYLIILLIDERPEEVTDFKNFVKSEIISSTFDEPAESHIHAAEMVIGKARRMVEFGKNVIILLDSITRLARAYNTMMPSSGKILSGGVESNALQRPKHFFGSARSVEGGGSLTIIGSALIDTGNRMDDVIFEEFKGTGNMELHLDRALSNKRIYPAFEIDKSATRKEELLYHPEEMEKVYILRRAMQGLPSTESMEMLIKRIQKTKTNAEFLIRVSY